ncbi:MAG: hypothetical protein ACE5PM_05545 [Candidatus Hydrothermarchaeales archaeon]
MIEEWLEDVMKDEEKRVKLFYYIHIAIQVTNVMIMIGLIILIFLILKPI